MPKKHVTPAEHGYIVGHTRADPSVKTTKLLMKTTHKSKSTIYRHAASNSIELPDASAGKSHPKLTEDDKKLFADAAEAYGPIYFSDLPALCHDATGKTVSKDTCARALRDSGLKLYTTSGQPDIPPDNFQLRVTFVKQIKDKVSRTLFLDESTIGRMHFTTPSYWGHRPRMFHHVPMKSSIRTNMVGGICAGGVVPLLFPESTVTGESFSRMLDQMLAAVHSFNEDIKYVVMDNTRIHGVPAVEEVLQNHRMVRLDLPTYSPDLNPIEHMWAWIKTNVNKANPNTQYQSITELDKAAQGFWAAMNPTGVLQKYAETLAAVKNAGGQYTGG